jgi:hypothetical protein
MERGPASDLGIDSNVLHYKQQTDEAKKRAANFSANRIPKFLGYLKEF